MDARYRFAVRFRLDAPPGVSIEPAEFETGFRYTVPPPGEGDDWLFFRDHLWRGEVNDHDYVRGMVAEALGVPIVAVEFRAFETDPAYLDALRDAIGTSLREFRADAVDAVLSKYFGSAIEVRRPEDV